MAGSSTKQERLIGFCSSRVLWVERLDPGDADTRERVAYLMPWESEIVKELAV